MNGVKEKAQKLKTRKSRQEDSGEGHIFCVDRMKNLNYLHAHTHNSLEHFSLKGL